MLSLLVFASFLVKVSANIPFGTTTQRLTWGGRTRTFIVNRPANVGIGTPAGLVFVFHGYTNTASWMNTAAAVMSVATSKGFIGVTPQGVSNSWNAGSCCGEAVTLRIDDVGFAKEMVEWLSSQDASIDKDRIFTTGYSNGGMVSYRIICEAGDVFKAGGGYAGQFYTSYSCTPSIPRPYAHMHGTSDSVIRFNGANTAYIRYVTNVQGCGSRYSTIYTNPNYYDMKCYARITPCSGSYPFTSVWCTYTGMGHIIPANGLLRQWNFWTTGGLALPGMKNETAADMLDNSTAWAKID